MGYRRDCSCLGSSKDVASYHTSFRGLAQESSKGDDRRHAGAVEEEERGQTLQADGVCEVGQVVGGLSLDVHEEAPEEPEEGISWNSGLHNVCTHVN